MTYRFPLGTLAAGICAISLGGGLLGGCALRSQPLYARATAAHDQRPPAAEAATGLEGHQPSR